jgi:TonB family protein
MKDRFYRNLPTPICLPSDVVIKFFLTADGFVRDASVEKSSGSRDADLACLDAAYCASPLSPPPPLRMVPPPPPAGMMLPPSYYGTGVYHFTFAGKNRALAGESNAARGFEYLLIPRDVAFRYGGFFTVAELESGSNKLQLAHPADALENTRFQWAQFYKNYPKATKEEVLRWSKTISDVYLQKGATAWF